MRDALVQKHISFQVPLKFRITETLTGYKRKVGPLPIGGNWGRLNFTGCEGDEGKIDFTAL